MLDHYRDLIDGLLESPGLVRSALGTPVADETSPELHAALRELAAREAMNLRRSQAVMRHQSILLREIGDEPEMQAIVAGKDGRSAEDLVAAFSVDRSELISLLVNLTLKDWDRKIEHDRLGESVLADEIEDHVAWDEAIVDRIRAQGT